MNGSFIDHYERKMIAGSTSFQFSCCLNFLIDFSGESDDTLFKNSEKFWKGDGFSASGQKLDQKLPQVISSQDACHECSINATYF
jgi:hypothetical protein